MISKQHGLLYPRIITILTSSTNFWYYILVLYPSTISIQHGLLRAGRSVEARVAPTLAAPPVAFAPPAASPACLAAQAPKGVPPRGTFLESTVVPIKTPVADAAHELVCVPGGGVVAAGSGGEHALGQAVAVAAAVIALQSLARYAVVALVALALARVPVAGASVGALLPGVGVVVALHPLRRPCIAPRTSAQGAVHPSVQLISVAVFSAAALVSLMHARSMPVTSVLTVAYTSVTLFSEYRLILRSNECRGARWV